MNSSHAQIGTILTRLTAQRLLTNTNITTKTGARSITPLNVGYSDDSIMAIMYDLAGLSGAAGNLAAVTALGNTTTLLMKVFNSGAGYEASHAYNTYSLAAYPSSNALGSFGIDGGIAKLRLYSTAAGYSTTIQGTGLTADRAVLLPDEGDGVGLDATLVTHTTEDALTVTDGTNVATYDKNVALIDDGVGNQSAVLPSYVVSEITAGTTVNNIKHQPTSFEYNYTNSVGSISKITTLHFERPSFTSGSQDVWFPSATNDTLAVKGDITAMGNFATADLTLTGDRTHNFTGYSMTWDSVQHFRINDSLGNAIISNPASGINMVEIRHLTGLGSAPSIVAGTGAGTAPTVSVGSGSTDLSGYVNITTGTTCATDATVVTLTFSTAYQSAPRCIIITPANKITQNLTKGKECFVDQASITSTTFTITSNTTALTDATAYQWYYTVIQ